MHEKVILESYSRYGDLPYVAIVLRMLESTKGARAVLVEELEIL